MINNYPLIINYSGLAFSRLLMDGGGGGGGKKAPSLKSKNPILLQ